jgi:RNA polymerase sigma factor (sigma-70 family)
MYSDRSRENFDVLWRSFKEGSKTAFSAIYEMYVKDLMNYGYKVTTDRNLIEDSIQDLFVELWQTRERISETTSIRFYLFRALRYKICRNIKLNGLVECADIEKRANDLCYDSHESYLIVAEVQSLQMENIKELISKLPKRQQEAINLRYYHNFSNQEIAQIMDVNYQSACKFIYTALQTLKQNLQVSVSSFLFFLIFF